MPLTERFELRLTSAEKDRLAAKAAEFGLSISEYVRCATGLSELPHQMTDVAEETYFRLGEVYGELGRVGSNLNQITHAIHQQSVKLSAQQEVTQALNSLKSVVDDLKTTIRDVRSQLDRTSKPTRRE
jgi:methyl-accepting chemotaxis protein